MTFRKTFLLALLATAIPAPLLAQEAPPAPDAEEALEEELVEEEEEIVVVGQRRRQRGAVIGDIEPEIQLDRRDIRALGASNLAEVLDAIAPQTQSGRGRGGGRPVVLVNGRRISSFSEIRDLPPEAVTRIDILPEQVALSYGYRADQRVVNFVLRNRFRAVTTELEAGVATAGGRASYEAEANVVQISGPERSSLDVEYEHNAALLESERDLLQAEGQEDFGDFRTLLPETDRFALNGAYSRNVFGNVAATINGRFEATRDESLFGLPSADLTIPADSPFSPDGAEVAIGVHSELPRALTRESHGHEAHLGLALNGDVAPWIWSFTANADRTHNVRRSDTGLSEARLQERLDAGDPDFDPYGELPADLLTLSPSERARTSTQVANAEAVASGPLIDLPAGRVRTTVKAGVEARGFESETFRGGQDRLRALSREEANAQASIDVPIADRGREVLAFLGDLSVNGNARIQHLSDFGTLTTVGYGLNWSPIEEVRINASVTEEEGAPGMQQLGDPLILTPNIRVFDFGRGETVDVTRIDGGNPDLLADSRRVFGLGVNVRPLEETDLSISANYTNTRIMNPIVSFPTATAEIEAAFPERFVRDAEGRLLSVDSRPVNFARSERQEIRWGFNFSKPVGPQPPTREERRERRAQREEAEGHAGAPPAEGAPEAGGGRRRGGGGFGGGGRGFGGRGFGGGGGARGGRLQLALYHTWRLQDEILIREGVPDLDLLNGSATGSRGGQPRHEFELRAGYTRNGFGGRLSANWQSGTFVEGGPAFGGGTSSDLFFSDFATVNLRLFADLGAQRSLVRDNAWLRGTRISLRVDNVFDSRLQVTDGSGTTPLSYQPGLLDPLGRSVRISLRKLFF